MGKRARVYDGSAWQDIATAVPDLSSYQAVANTGLQLVKKQTIGSGVSSVVVTDAFSATYDNYRLILNGTIGSSASDILISFGSGNHYGSTAFDSYTSSPVGVNRRNNASSLFLGGISTSLAEHSCSVDVYAPFLTRSTGISGTYYGGNYSGFIGGTFASTASLTQFTLTAFTGTLTGGSVTIYGYNKG